MARTVSDEIHCIIDKEKCMIISAEKIVGGSIKKTYCKCEDEIMSYFYGIKSEYKNTFTTADENVTNNEINKIVASVDIMNYELTKSNFIELFDNCKKAEINPLVLKNSLDKLIELCRIKVSDFEKAYSENEFCSKINIKDYVKYIINLKEEGNVIYLWFENVIKEMKIIRENRGDKIIEFAKQFINENYRSDISLTDVADKVYLNTNYFSEIFKKKVGKNYKDYLIELRIEESKKLLKKPGVKIYEVANDVGYKENVSFNRAFKRVVGMSPKEYINLVR